MFLLTGTVSLGAQTDADARLDGYAARYVRTTDAKARLETANEFFAFLHSVGYIDEPVVFPASAHMDSVDVNVYYYIAEWHYMAGAYASAADYCTRATHCMGEVDDVSRSDVYSLLGAAYFRMSEFDKAVEALNESYLLDKKSGDFDRMSSTLNGIASVFTAAGKPEEAEKYILESIAANSLTDNLSRRAVLLGTASEIYRSLERKEKALDYALQALAIERQTGDSTRIGVRLSQVANAQLGLAKTGEAKRTLLEAMPLLLAAGNNHSWGICQNQMGDILAEEGEETEAAEYYRRAAMLFLRQGDKYNELHAREGLYRVTKDPLPQEAIIHLERAKQLQDSIYRQETGEAVGRYNAIYYNDILRQERELAELQKRKTVSVAVGLGVLALVLIILAVCFTWRRHKSLKGKYSEINRLYRNSIARDMQQSGRLTDDDKQFLQRLAEIIGQMSENGGFDVNAIAGQMHVSTLTLRRRLAHTLGVTPQTYIMQVRMEKARFLLLNYRDITIAEVAEKCGYTQVPNFTRAFTRFYGITPTETKGNEERKQGERFCETTE